ncbi:MAG: diguanylate cyclase, partial [Acidobacteria bacterium]|nr:diguanylate cyclase [Acidobacteriota bacterium]
MAAQQVDQVDSTYVRDRALDAVVANLAPAPFLMLPFVVLISTLLRTETSSQRIGWWLIVAVLATVVGMLALHRCRSRRGAGLDPLTKGLVGVTFVAVGAVFGMCPWVGADSRLSVVLLYTIFPATASAVGCIVAAGRRDMYLAFLVPLVGISAYSLAVSGSTHLRGLAALSVFYGMGLLVLHHVVSRSVLDAIHLQWRSERLVVDLDHERQELTSVNDELAATNMRLTHQATHDPLTGLFNRRGTLEFLEHVLATVSEQRPVGLLFLDLDRFKAVNDALGHRGGDRFITIIADRLLRSLEPGSVAGRMGGDEFVVIVPGSDMTGAAAVADRLVGVLAQPVYAEGREMPSSVSIGVASAPSHGTGSSELLRHANAALYRAKARGRNRVELFDLSMQQELLNRLEAEAALRRAVEDGEIVAFFQPELDATTGHLVGAELLARWIRRDGSVVPANEFLEVAQSAALLDRITERVITHARPHMRRLALLGLPKDFRFRVNLASERAEHRWHSNLVEWLLQDLDPHIVTVDVHESAVSGDLAGAAANLAGFRARGGRVCLDDFARGVSSLSL